MSSSNPSAEVQSLPLIFLNSKCSCVSSLLLLKELTVVPWTQYIYFFFEKINLHILKCIGLFFPFFFDPCITSVPLSFFFFFFFFN